MSAAAEKRAEADAVRHAEEFRKRHGVSDAEWTLAEAMTEDYLNHMRRIVWQIFGFTED